jgi:hypothetical protein
MCPIFAGMRLRSKILDNPRKIGKSACATRPESIFKPLWVRFQDIPP